MKISPSNYLLNYWARVQNACLCLPKPDQEKLTTPIPVVQITGQSARGQDEVERGDTVAMPQLCLMHCKSDKQRFAADYPDSWTCPAVSSRCSQEENSAPVTREG